MDTYYYAFSRQKYKHTENQRLMDGHCKGNV